MKDRVARFLQEEGGATALEYGLIAGLIAVAVIAAVATFTTALTGLFDKLTTLIDSQ